MRKHTVLTALLVLLGSTSLHAAPPAPTTSVTTTVKPKTKATPPATIPLAYPSPFTGKTDAVLLTEIVALEQQLAKTDVTDAKHVTIAMRLATNYWELETLKVKAWDAASSKDDKAKARALRDKSRQRANDVFRLVIDKHDDYPKLDETLYYLAREHETYRSLDPSDAADTKTKKEAREKALATYLELLKKRPTSPLVAWAYIAFADLYFDDAAAGKIDWKIPLEAYKRATTTGDADKQPRGYAHYRLGFVHWNLEDATSAKSAFKSSEDFGTKNPTVVGSPELVTESQKATKSL